MNKRNSVIVTILLLFVAGVTTAQIIPSTRRVQWEGNVGRIGDIPNRPVFAYVTSSPYNATGNGATDDSAAIQAAINACPSGQAVFVPAGVYLLKHKIRMKSNVTLRGAGRGITILKGASGFTENYLVGFETSGINYTAIYEAARDVNGGLTKGSTSISVSSTGWSVGDIILIDQLQNPSGDPMITTNGTSGTASWLGRENGNRPIGQVDQVTSVGGTVGLEIPIYFDFDMTKSPQAVRITPKYVMTSSGVEDLSIDNSSSVNSSQSNYGTAYMQSAVGCWLLNVDVNTTYKTGILISNGYRNIVRGCTINYSYAYTADAGYGLWLTDSASGNLVENNIFTSLTVGVIMAGPVSGNVISYNYMTNMISTTYPTTIRNGILIHGGHPTMNLFEGNYLEGPNITADMYWGTSSDNTYLRNSVSLDPTKTVDTTNVEIWKGQTYYNFIGNVLGNGLEKKYQDSNLYNGKMIYSFDYTNSGSMDGKTAATILLHGNYDTLSGTVWDAAIPDRVIPSSYYLTMQPSWWSGALWPPIGSDLSVKRGDIPARIRSGNSTPTSKTPEAPLHLRIKS